MSGKRAPDEERRFVLPCGCGREVSLKHYEIVRCSKCQQMFWALRPERLGPLVLFKWPGLWVIAQQEAEKVEAQSKAESRNLKAEMGGKA